jgi:uncharacterized DUF497 family protein
MDKEIVVKDDAKVVDWINNFREAAQKALPKTKDMRCVAINFTYLNEENVRIVLGISHESYNEEEYDNGL